MEVYLLKMKAITGMVGATILIVASVVPATTSLAVHQRHTVPATYNVGDKGETLTMSGGGVLLQGYSDAGMPVCSSQESLQYTQTRGYLPDGQPIFTVTFSNTCPSCGFFDVHINCAEFSSAVFVDPIIFKKLSDGDCLLSNGGLLTPEDIISFEYSSTFAYPMAIRTALPACL